MKTRRQVIWAGAVFVALARNLLSQEAPLSGLEKERATAAFVSIAEPKFYTRAELDQVIQEKLGATNAALAPVPFESDSEIESWAVKITTGATNDEAKAKLIFQEMVRRPTSVDNRLASMRTAKDVFQVWNKPDVALYCKDAALLYIALARAVGLRAYDVDVQVEAGGGMGGHDCAAVFLDGKAVLADVAAQWFGAPHKKFVVLNDVEAVAVYACQLPGFDHANAAHSLAPEVGLVELVYFENLVGAGRLQQAREELPAVKRAGVSEAMSNYADALLAGIDGRPESAVESAKKAIALEPGDATYYLTLANACAQQEKWDEARDALKAALKCNMTSDGAVMAEVLLRNPKELEAWGAFNSGSASINTGKFPEALKKFDEVLSVKPQFGDAFLGRALSKRALGDTNGAAADFQRAVELKPEIRGSMPGK